MWAEQALAEASAPLPPVDESEAASEPAATAPPWTHEQFDPTDSETGAHSYVGSTAPTAAMGTVGTVVGTMGKEGTPHVPATLAPSTREKNLRVLLQEHHYCFFTPELLVSLHLSFVLSACLINWSLVCSQLCGGIRYP